MLKLRDRMMRELQNQGDGRAETARHTTTSSTTAVRLEQAHRCPGKSFPSEQKSGPIGSGHTPIKPESRTFPKRQELRLALLFPIRAS